MPRLNAAATGAAAVVFAAFSALFAMPSPAAATVTVSVTPPYTQLPVAQTAQFSAHVSGATNTGVVWQVDNIVGGNSSVGTVSAAGLYTAPSTQPSPEFATVTAVSQADPTASATATITLVAHAATGSTFFVATTGNDANPGTSAHPWKTISHAASEAAAGDTVNVEPGVYKELVTFTKSGNASAGYITFLGPGAVIDGTGLTIPNGQGGLLTMANVADLVIAGFELRNYETTSVEDVPIGIYVTGSDANIQLINNNIHNIITTAATNPQQCGSNALGIAVYGSRAPQAIAGLVISGNSLHNLKTGCSESMSLDGNVDNFAVVSNRVYDNNNIGIDAIGFEHVSPEPADDQARHGVIRGNTVFGITSFGNPDYGDQYAADGIYVDGGLDIVVEQNRVYSTDIGIEMASEHAGHVTSGVIARNNVVYYSNSVGITIGGYSAQVGGTDHCTIVNNTLFDNDTKMTGSGEFQIQFHATNNVFKNNIAYANGQGLLINNFTTSEADPAVVDYNLYFSGVGAANAEWIWEGKGYIGYQNYQKATGLDAHSPFANPRFVSTANPPNLDLQTGSPAIGKGVDLGAAVVGTVDFAGNPRVTGGSIDIGAYQP